MSEWDQDLDEALQSAHLPALLASLTHITGDASWLRPEWMPTYVPLSRGDPGLPAEVQAEIRAKAKVAIEAFLKDRTVKAATPDLPTMIESGLPSYDLTVWFGLVSSAGTPRPIIDRLNREVVEILRDPSFKAGFTQFGIDLMPSTPEELGDRIRKDLPVWTKVMRDAGIQPE